jgi:hypothetical protein
MGEVYRARDTKLGRDVASRPGTGRWGDAHAVPIPLFEINVLLYRSFFPYDVSSDGRFLVNTVADPGSSLSPITVVLNWMAELDRK